MAKCWTSGSDVLEKFVFGERAHRNRGSGNNLEDFSTLVWPGTSGGWNLADMRGNTYKIEVALLRRRPSSTRLEKGALVPVEPSLEGVLAAGSEHAWLHYGLQDQGISSFPSHFLHLPSRGCLH